MTKKHLQFILLLLSYTFAGFAQTVRENIPAGTSPEHKWWNLLHYSIDITPDYDRKFIKGSNSIRFSVLQTGKIMQINLQQPMQITAISWNKTALEFTKNGETYLISFARSLQKGETETITIQFQGNPQTAKNAPWDSGWIWATDKEGRPWMSIASEGSGASIWLPCKNVSYDEPDDGISFAITVPDTLVAVANGRLSKKLNNKNGTATYTWTVLNPINNYNIIPYIGKYVTWHHDYPGVKGNLDCDYWVLDYNVDKAKNHLRQVDTMLHCFEYWLGPYPFYEDSYKVVEAPMVGMEHQSAIAYGNGFENGYSGKNLSGTSWGLKWDFILVHESGHEWFGNSITEASYGESWIHEGFTKYLETIYTEWLFGKEAGKEYTAGISKRIKNDEPVIGSGSPDQYSKGAAMLHMIRQIIGDNLFKGLLHELNKKFYHQTVSTEQVINLVNDYTKQDLTKIFDQYLRTTKVPMLEYSFEKNIFKCRWTNCVDGFDMPLKVSFNNQDLVFIYPTDKWKKIPAASTALKSVTADRNFYAEIKEIK